MRQLRCCKTDVCRRLLVWVPTIAVALAAFSFESDDATAQQPDATRSRLATLFVATAATPGGNGLLPAAIAEARIALSQAVLAEKASGDLVAMQRAATNVLHAVDPALVPDGAGMGLGVRPAVSQLISQLNAMGAESTESDVAYATPKALAAALMAQAATDALIGAAQQLRNSSTATEAEPLARQMRQLASDVLVGPETIATRAPSPSGVGGLYGVQAKLAPLVLVREGTLPSSLRERPEGRR